MTVTVDVGSHYIWMARYFKSYEPRHLLSQMGCKLWGLLFRGPSLQLWFVLRQKSFLFLVTVFPLLSEELETAVRLKLPIVHIIWNDWSLQYGGIPGRNEVWSLFRVDFGPVVFVKYAESFGAKGYRATSKEELLACFKKLWLKL